MHWGRHTSLPLPLPPFFTLPSVEDRKGKGRARNAAGALTLATYLFTPQPRSDQESDVSVPRMARRLLALLAPFAANSTSALPCPPASALRWHGSRLNCARMGMSIDELARHYLALPPPERARFAAMVRAHEVFGTPTWREEIARRHRAIDAGNGVRVFNATQAEAVKAERDAEGFNL
jgi:hypothetical protein